MAQFFPLCLGYSPLQLGARLLAWSMPPMFIAPLAGSLADRYGNRPFMVLGLALQAAGLAWVAAIASPHVEYLQIGVALLIAGTGTSSCFPTVACSASPSWRASSPVPMSTPRTPPSWPASVTPSGWPSASQRSVSSPRCSVPSARAGAQHPSRSRWLRRRPLPPDPTSLREALAALGSIEGRSGYAAGHRTSLLPPRP
jgi:Major Facilitator Superfamily